MRVLSWRDVLRVVLLPLSRPPIDRHRRACCGLFELLTPVMLLTETQLRDAVIGLISLW